MSHGNSLITKVSAITDKQRDILLSADYFGEKKMLNSFEERTNLFFYKSPNNDIEKTIIDILINEGLVFDDKYIEYWFQHQKEGDMLGAHCDFNYVFRELQSKHRSLENFDMDRYVTPLTIVCYLQCESMIGGELGISHYSWKEEEDFDGSEDHEYINKRIEDFEKEIFTPKEKDIIIFDGSTYYHWIEPLQSGERKSIAINFWNESFENMRGE